ncbi:Holliday junction branch migration protein RuvA [Halieaceae bacterium IMCC14734]|uniref:Holliday junction branch migration complex subunit RuvA n=1 Tax=Candidatus Litorirhabdus singularis TaxID=2518993 RepID=A0ABT3TAQ3_9GAMM|nr:Holliday junction branch migration protein RuvA [Candidatus Litorirhabdus singularis]MCX2979330.1 Holliday junction branch migration protein RuvA [Candidatus Litorirhabdus singularis]
MIGRISGTLLEKQPPEILLDVGGVGYEIQVPMTTLYELPVTGTALTLFTHFVVREDAQLLYGFSSERDRHLFRSLIKVSGVGPKLALGILSGMDADSFVRTVQRDDISTLVKLPGVGKKTAERLLIEMRDRLKDWMLELAEPTAATTAAASDRDMLAEAESALVALGYKPAEASRAVAAANDDSIERSEELIRRALQSMVRGK